MIYLRIMFGMVWCIVLFIFTCTVSLTMLVNYHFIHFIFTNHPDWRDLLVVNDINLHYKKYVISKIGHFTGFFILSLSLL